MKLFDLTQICLSIKVWKIEIFFILNFPFEGLIVFQYFIFTLKQTILMEQLFLIEFNCKCSIEHYLNQGWANILVRARAVKKIIWALRGPSTHIFGKPIYKNYILHEIPIN